MREWIRTAAVAAAIVPAGLLAIKEASALPISELLLVGSLPADTTESALRAGAEFFGDLVFALPDGETGPRRAWVGSTARPTPPR